jgi:hypothetical protein
VGSGESEERVAEERRGEERRGGERRGEERRGEERRLEERGVGERRGEERRCRWYEWRGDGRAGQKREECLRGEGVVRRWVGGEKRGGSGRRWKEVGGEERDARRSERE